MIPVVAIYSSLQRAVDQMIEDVCLQNLHVIFAVDRAGLVGSDGETHQGCFDLTYLSMIPNMTVMAPKNKWELSDMMKFAVNLMMVLLQFVIQEEKLTDGLARIQSTCFKRAQ